MMSEEQKHRAGLKVLKAMTHVIKGGVNAVPTLTLPAMSLALPDIGAANAASATADETCRRAD